MPQQREELGPVENLVNRMLRERIGEIERAVFRTRHSLPPLRVAPGAPGPDQAGRWPEADWPEVPVGGHWGGPDQTVWLHGPVEIPADWAGQAVYLIVRLGDYEAVRRWFRLAGPEALAYLDGAPYAGIDSRHEAIRLADPARGGERWDLAIEAYASRPEGPHTLRTYELATRDPDATALASDLRTAYDALSVLDPSTSDASWLRRAIEAALGAADLRRPGSDVFYASLGPARRAFAEALKGYVHGTRPTVVATGHAHIDVAWLWPLAQTRRKAARTFSTVLRLMEQYPEFHFTQSQPQLYQYIKEDEPALYEQIKRRVAEGRWEPTGGMWLEPDCNLPRGESLVRQLVYGQRFFEAEFGRRSDLLWLPDAFGYSWVLPQLLRGAGITRFLTSKISWNQFNRFPYDTFRWRGVDGSEVLAQFITTPVAAETGFAARFYTYNGAMTAGEVLGTARSNRQSDLNDRLLYLFGWGDGGGGPTGEMLEAARRLGNLPGMPALEQGSAEETLRQIDVNVHRDNPSDRVLPVWDGELYLEYHRGTYTSQGRTKYAHRRAELALHEAELWSAVARPAGTGEPWTALDDAWRTLLLQEFHDILPGSAINEVYQDAARDLASVIRRAEEVRDAALDQVLAGQASEPALAFFNPTPWVRHDPVEVAWTGAEPPADLSAAAPQVLDAPVLDSNEPGVHRALVAPHESGVPGFGHVVVTPGSPVRSDLSRSLETAGGGLRIEERRLENAFFRIELDESMNIRSLVDKRVPGGREVIAADAVGNRLIAFEDKPLNWDAWDIDLFYQEKPYPIDEVVEARVVERGPLRGALEIRRRFLDSTIVQRIVLYRDLPRIDVPTEIDWRQHQILLKVAFPVTVRATEATFEIQFGTIQRPTHWNTSWDVARFEVSAQRWADLSEGDYGVALLNDGKYGYDVHDNVLRLTLLKSGIIPDPEADQGIQRFTYSLLPHLGDWRAGEVIAHAAALNLPLRARWVTPGSGAEKASATMESGLVATDRPGLIVDTVKPAADGRGLVVRLYEGHGTRGPATLRFAQPVAEVETCNLLEERQGVLDHVAPNAVALNVRPYEVVTLRVIPARTGR